jgi:hypothetical protein
MATLNATKNAVAAEVQLKTLAGVTTDATLARFTGTVTCYLDDATGDVVGLQFGFAAPLCTNTGTTRTFTVPADGYIASMKVAVDPKTDWIGQVAFTIKSNSSLAPTNVITCGSRGVVGVDVMPKLTALASVSGACRPASAAGRRLAQSAVGLDPASLRISVTSIAAADGAVPLVSCLKTVTDQLVLAASPFFVPIQMTVTAVGGGGGAGGNINGCSGGGGSSAVVVSGGGGERGGGRAPRRPTLFFFNPPPLSTSRSKGRPSSSRPAGLAPASAPPATTCQATTAPSSRRPRRCPPAPRSACTWVVAGRQPR